MANYVDGMDGGKHNSDNAVASFYAKPKKRIIVKPIIHYHFYTTENGKMVKKQFSNHAAALVCAKENKVGEFFDENGMNYTV